MICESQLITIISTNYRHPMINNHIKHYSRIHNFENIFSQFFNKSKLKSKLNYIFSNINIPKESFYIAIYYLNRYYYKQSYLNNSNKYLENYSIYDINNYVIASIIIANKQLLDVFCVKNFCNLINFNFNLFCEIELDILKSINWETFYYNNEYLKFKNFLEHYMD